MQTWSQSALFGFRSALRSEYEKLINEAPSLKSFSTERGREKGGGGGDEFQNQIRGEQFFTTWYTPVSALRWIDAQYPSKWFCHSNSWKQK